MFSAFESWFSHSDHYVELYHEPWPSRLGNSCRYLCVGPMLGIVAVVVLFWNEGRAVHRFKDLEESSGLVRSVSDPSHLDHNLDGELVHVSGEAHADALLEDDTFGIREDAIRMRRQVETYQWVEYVEKNTQKNKDGSTTTSYEYDYYKEWHEMLIDSDYFRYPLFHRNPRHKLYDDETWTADAVMLGGYNLSDCILSGMEWWTKLDDLSNYEKSIPRTDGYTGRVYNNNKIYYGNSPYFPRVGDTRITYYIVPAGEISVMAEQAGDTFVPYHTSRGGEVSLVEKGTVGARQMIEDAELKNTVIAWAIRFGGFFLLFLTFIAYSQPLLIFSDVLPFVGNTVRGGVVPCLASIFSAGIALFVISIAWLFYRPVSALCMLIILGSVAILVLGEQQRQREEEEEYDDDEFESDDLESYPAQPYYQYQAKEGLCNGYSKLWQTQCP